MKKAIIFQKVEDKNKYDQFIENNNSNSLKNYQSFLISEFNNKNIYKIGLNLKEQEFSSFILFNGFELGFDYFEIRKHKILKIDQIDINIYFIVKNKNKYNYFYSNLNKLPIIYKNLIEKNKSFTKIVKKDDDTILVNKNIYRNNDFSFQFEKLKILKRCKDLSKLKKIIYDNSGFYNLAKRQFIKIDQKYFEDFLKQVKNNYFDGKDNNLKIQLIKISEDKDKIYYDFSHNHGKFLLIKEKKDNKFYFETNFYSKTGIEVLRSDTRLKSIISKFSNPIVKKKTSIKNIFLVLLSFIILGTTLWFTFGVLYEGSYTNVFKILGAGTDKVGFYILILNFFVSIFFSMFLMLIFNYIENKKFNWKSAVHWFFAAQIRFFVLGLTGNHILSIFFYTLYISKAIKISKPKIGGIIGAGFIFRGIIHLLSGVVFVTIGFIYLFTFNIGSYDMNSYVYVILALSLGGLFISTGFSILSGLIIINGKIHDLYTYLYLKIKLFLNKDTDYFRLFNSIENKSYELTISSKKWLKNKKLLIRTSIVIFIFFIFEAIETMIAYDLTVNYVNTELIPDLFPNIINQFPNLTPNDLYLDTQYNFIEFAGLRSIVKNANDFFPFIPFGYVEYMVNGLYNIILWQNIYDIASANSIPFDQIINNSTANNFVDAFSASTTFITMFFGKYMRLIFSFFIFSYFIFNQFFLKIIRNKDVKQQI
ncbi:/ / hypothetical protein / 443283:445388 Reverse [Candidatus Hepatoplasma crinochetorum]|uniref:Uncharacterized protein n=1 Tax=Candidatus Hepatoplasma crinochetorum TaxID=295596 RepID=A0A0G7ZN69_9MOLU|nr:/ / hypothetical protein / 443283:445388 Reverse [Candidatus Hepatoplasma crinochetorum]